MCQLLYRTFIFFYSLFVNSASILLGLRYALVRQRSHAVAFISRVAMVGIMVGVSLLIIVLSVMNGFDKELRERILRIVPQITLYHHQGLSNWSSVRQHIIKNGSIEAASPFVGLQGMVNSGNKTTPISIYGIHEKLESSTSIIHQFLQEKTLSILSKDPLTIVLGYEIAKKIKIKPGSMVNIIIPRREVKVAGYNLRRAESTVVRRLQVIDILKTDTEVDDSFAIMGIAAAAALSIHPEVVSGLHLKVKNLFLAPSIAHALEAELAYGFYTVDWTSTHGNIYYAIQMSKRLVSLLLFLIIAIAVFNVVSTLVMVVIDKQSDIAILRTLGASNRQIVSIFMIQGIVISTIGTVIGVVLGVIVSSCTEDIVLFIESLFDVHFLNTDIYPISYLPSHLLCSDIVLIVVVSLLMSFLVSIYPAWCAAKLEPAELLRYE